MSKKTPSISPIAKEGFWCLHRRVPKPYAPYERRAWVTISTGIRVAQDPRAILARQKIETLDRDLKRYWESLSAGETPASAKAIFAAKKLAVQQNCPVVTDASILSGHLTELARRMELLIPGLDLAAAIKDPPDTLAARITLAAGLPEREVSDDRSGLRVSQMIEEVERINATTLAQKSPAQRKRWKDHRQTNLDLLLRIIGSDPLVAELSTKHTHPFRQHFQSRVLNNEIEINSANRAMNTVAGLYSVIANFYQYEVKNPFTGTRILGGQDGKRVPFDPAFIQSHILREGFFDEVNPEARRLIYLTVETGLRLSEACGLTEEDIHLDRDFPYVKITRRGRTTKTLSSVREIPLVGVSLLAMRAQPKGFPRYRDKADTASALIYKALKARDCLLEGQSLYSLRHSLSDRLRAVEAPRDVIEDIMGHTHMYGDGSSLEHKRKYLQKIALVPPATI